jgi:hypothetical protein
VEARFALYSGNSWVRNVFLETSKATAICEGFSSLIRFINIEANPYIALVGWPFEVLKFSAGKA